MKRRLFKLVVFLLLGAIVNVAVAWGCAVWVDPFEGRHEHARVMLDRLFLKQRVNPSSVTPSGQWVYADGYQLWWVDCYRRFGSHRLVRGPISSHKPQFSRTNILGYLPGWSDFDRRTEELGFMRGFEVIDGRGWPAVGLCSRFKIAGGGGIFGEQWSYTEPASTRESGLILDDKKVTRLPAGWVLAEARRSLPLDPVLGGFAFNTVFYAVLLAMMMYGPKTARRVIWVRRGGCPECGYDLRGEFSAGCSECGWRREDVS